MTSNRFFVKLSGGKRGINLDLIPIGLWIQTGFCL